MCGDGKEAYRMSVMPEREDIVNSIAAVCNMCSFYCTCTMAKRLSVPERCAEFTAHGQSS